MPIEKVSGYREIQAKAAEIYRSGGVEPTGIGATFVEARVTSPSGQTYLSMISFSMGSDKIDGWACDCLWSQYNYKRAPEYEYLAHKKCSHCLSVYYYTLAFRMSVGPKLRQL